MGGKPVIILGDKQEWQVIFQELWIRNMAWKQASTLSRGWTRRDVPEAGKLEEPAGQVITNNT